jgi:hypothetical protein
MRIVRLIMLVLVVIGLSLSPVAARLVVAHIAGCGTGWTSVAQGHPAVETAGSASTAADQCLCCIDGIKCPPVSCYANCFGANAVLAGEVTMPDRSRNRLGAPVADDPGSLAFAPDPPPPRA